MIKNRFKTLLVLVSMMALSLMVKAQGADITVWLTGDDTGAAVLQEVANVWAEETGNTVTVTAVGWGDAYAQSLAAVADGSGADIIIGGMSWGISLGNLGGMVDLGEAYPEAVEGISESSNPSFFNATKTVDGKVYYVPFNLDTMVMYYKPADFEEAGVAVPATWEDVEAAADAGLKGAWSWGNASWLGFQGVLKQAGGDWYTADCSAAAINSEAGMLALEHYAALYDDYGFPAEQVVVADALATDYSYVFSGEWEATGIDNAHPELAGLWEVGTLPAGPTGSFNAFIGGKGAGIFTHSANPDAAMDLLVFLNSSEAQQQLAEVTMATANSIHVPPQLEAYEFIQGGDNVREAISKQLTDASGPANCPGWEEATADVDLILQSVLFEEADFEDALVELEDALNAALEEYGAAS